MENRYIVNYDIKQKCITNIRFKQGDIDSSVLEVHLLDNGLAVDITGEIIEFRFLKPDDTICFQDSTAGVTTKDAINGAVECVLKSNTLAAAGLVKCEVHRSKDGKQLTIPSFYFTVESSIDGSGVASTNYISALDNYPTTLANINSQLADIVSQSYPHVYNADVGLRKWRATMAQMKAGIIPFIDIPVLGDSLGDGYGVAVADYLTKGYLGRIRAGLASKYGDAGTGLITSFFPYNDTPKAWTYTGNWSVLPQGFVGGCRQSFSNGDTAQLNFNGTGICIIFVGDSWGGVGGRTCNIQIDGGTAISFDTYSSQHLVPITKTITGLTDGSHTLTITSTSANHVFVCGAYPIKSTSGIRVHHTGRSGAKASDYLSDSTRLAFSVDMWNPPLTIINLGANEFLENIDPNVYSANIQTLITRAKNYGDVLLIGDALSTNTQTYQQSQYIAILKQLAITNKIAYVDIYNRWGADANYAKNTFGLIYDYIHPNAAGYQDIATAILKVIDEY